MFAVIVIMAILIGSGVVLALPTYIPALRNQARQSPDVRKGLIRGFSLATFVIAFLFLTYQLTFLTTALGDTYWCYGDYNCPMPEYPFQDDPTRDKLLTLELWLQNTIPPILTNDTTCIIRDEDVCETLREIRRSSHLFSRPDMPGYIFLLLISLIPARSCQLMVRFITRDRRKEKPKLESQ